MQHPAGTATNSGSPASTHHPQTLTADVWEFDTLLSTYTKRAPMPAPRSRAGAAALGGKIYVSGGYASTGEQGE